MKFKIQVLIFLGVMFSAEAMATTITTSIGNGADSFITASSPSTNFGVSEVIGVKRDTALGNSRKGYLRFDIGSSFGSVSDASLNLSYAGTNSGSINRPANPSTYTVYGLKDNHLQENWSETGITWNNAPGNITSSTSGFNSSETTFLGTFDINFSTINIGDQLGFTTPALIDFLNDDSNGLISLLLSRSQANFSIEYFSSKENALLLEPTLSITAVPLPASLYFFGSAIMAMFTFRRDKKITT